MFCFGTLFFVIRGIFSFDNYLRFNQRATLRLFLSMLQAVPTQRSMNAKKKRTSGALRIQVRTAAGVIFSSMNPEFILSFGVPFC